VREFSGGLHQKAEKRLEVLQPVLTNLSFLLETGQQLGEIVALFDLPYVSNSSF
jgi:hypothetical protein